MIQRKPRSNAFFIEIIIVILFFSLSMAVILQLFVAAHKKSALSSERSQSMVQVQTLAEEFGALGTGEDPLGFLEVPVSSEGDTYTASLYFDDQWRSVEENPAYVLRVTARAEAREAGVMLCAELTAERPHAGQETETLYSLQTQKYAPGA